MELPSLARLESAPEMGFRVAEVLFHPGLSSGKSCGPKAVRDKQSSWNWPKFCSQVSASAGFGIFSCAAQGGLAFPSLEVSRQGLEVALGALARGQGGAGSQLGLWELRGSALEQPQAPLDSPAGQGCASMREFGLCAVADPSVPAQPCPLTTAWLSLRSMPGRSRTSCCRSTRMWSPATSRRRP